MGKEDGTYSAIRKNEHLSVSVRGMKLEPVVQSEVSQKERRNSVYYDI